MASATASPAFDYEPAGELKIGQVGIANLRVRTLEVGKLCAEMRERVARAPKLFERAAVVVDFGGLPGTPALADARALIDGLRESGVLPVALAYGSSDNGKLAEALGLPLLAKFRAQYEPVDDATAGAQVETPSAASASSPAASKSKALTAEAAPAKSNGDAAAKTVAPTDPGMILATPVRSGRQVYADNRDLTVLTSVGAGAEVIADGSIHIYGALRGRALAGAQGFEKARIFCREFHAELVAVAGHYKVLEDIPVALHGKSVQVWLENEEVQIAAME